MTLNRNYFVYILQCSDVSYYTGITNDLDTRVWQHNHGINPNSYTYTKRPVILKYFQYFQQVEEAIKWEKQLKGWSRKKKEALFNKNWDEIKKLASSSKVRLNSNNPSTSSG